MFSISCLEHAFSAISFILIINCAIQINLFIYISFLFVYFSFFLILINYSRFKYSSKIKKNIRL